MLYGLSSALRPSKPVFRPSIAGWILQGRLHVLVAKWIAFVGVIVGAIWVGSDISMGSVAWGSISALVTATLAFLALDATARRSSGGHPNDRALFRELLKLLPPAEHGIFFREHDFGNDFLRKYSDALYEFEYLWNSPDKHFIDPDLEVNRRSLYELGAKLAKSIAQCTTPSFGDYCSVVPRHIREIDLPRPPHVIAEAKLLNEASSDFSKQYDHFVEFARTRLNVGEEV